MKRLFCAIKVSPAEAIRDVLLTFREELYDERISWVAPENLHITLKFFGDTPGREESGIKEALSKAATRTPPFSFHLKSCGTFGNPCQPRVVWLGINGGEGIKKLYNEVNKSLEPLGYKPDRQLFVPHLTIGRIKHLGDTDILRELLGEFEHVAFGSADIRKFYLFQSILKPGGPEYRILHDFVL